MSLLDVAMRLSGMSSTSSPRVRSVAKRSVTNKAHDGPMIKQSELKKLLPYSRAKELCAAHGFSFSTMTDILYMKIINPSAFIASEICSHIGIDMRRVKWGE